MVAHSIHQCMVDVALLVCLCTAVHHLTFKRDPHVMDEVDDREIMV